MDLGMRYFAHMALGCFTLEIHENSRQLVTPIPTIRWMAEVNSAAQGCLFGQPLANIQILTSRIPHFRW